MTIIIGCRIVNYLLEKSRVVAQVTVYRIFSQHIHAIHMHVLWYMHVYSFVCMCVCVYV